MGSLAWDHAEGGAARAEGADLSTRSSQGRAQILEVEITPLGVAERGVPDDRVRGWTVPGPVHRVDQVALVARGAFDVEHRFVLGGLADFLKRGDRHRGQQADDDNNDHDFNECEAGCFVCLNLHS